MPRLLAIALALTFAACGGAQPPPPSNQPPAKARPRIALTKETLIVFFAMRFEPQVEAGVLQLDFGGGVEPQVIEELHLMGIDTTEELAAIVPSDYEHRGLTVEPTTNLAALVRDLMIIHDPERYFTRAWRNAWAAGPRDFAAAQAYGVELERLRRLGVFDDRDGD
jgi:hypothetical protein